eukprot:TRINITY_DN63340_c0_g1_i1.p1 TRINITY_DN63340_c0_g1~~TRINITY_DN63340_c0_g1_i1.p1  ORF type:complete len:114 (+),score=13.23 TRINITY_DN63340_c0_g1_i1:36-377(+)
MNKLIIVALLATLAASAIHKKTSMSRADAKLSLAEIDQDKFGNTMISAVALNMAVENPLEEITLLIDEIVNEISTDQATADEKNRTDQADCDTRISGAVQSLRELRDQLATAT